MRRHAGQRPPRVRVDDVAVLLEEAGRGRGPLRFDSSLDRGRGWPSTRWQRRPSTDARRSGRARPYRGPDGCGSLDDLRDRSRRATPSGGSRAATASPAGRPSCASTPRAAWPAPASGSSTPTRPVRRNRADERAAAYTLRALTAQPAPGRCTFLHDRRRLCDRSLPTIISVMSFGIWHSYETAKRSSGDDLRSRTDRRRFRRSKAAAIGVTP